MLVTSGGTTNNLTVTRGALVALQHLMLMVQLFNYWNPKAIPPQSTKVVLFLAADTTLTVLNASAASIVNNDYIRGWREIMQVTNVSTNDLTVTRGAFGTTANRSYRWFYSHSSYTYCFTDYCGHGGNHHC